jgi:hypothetical protein
LPQQWKEPKIAPIYERGDKAECNNCRGLSLLPNTYKTLNNILFSRLAPYINEVIRDNQCVLKHNRSITEQMFCIHQILEENACRMGQYIS